MKVTFLGTGTSQGVPMIACNCNVCSSNDWKDKRLRTSIMLTTEKANVVIDSGPDFRWQMLRNKVQRLDAVVFTHEHKDHIAGLDDVRAFNFKQKKPMQVFATQNVQIALKREYHYVFSGVKYPGLPKIEMIEINSKPFQIEDIELLPIKVMHYKLPVLGFRVKDFAYITDANFIDEKEMEKLKGVKILILNALRKEKHISHFTLDEAVALVKKIQPQQAYFTHISHLMGKHDEVNKELPENIALAYDGLAFEI